MDYKVMWFKFHSSLIFKITYIVRPCNVNRNATMKYNVWLYVGMLRFPQ